ncbi:hypothetical protein EMPG_11374 [Blastomyces silverae]|uniref:Uncharacterized protein n=1 Tax=Blastomyces silverae TaxID=2060906 RepID=A0A0H1BRF9_9EURO|nr:hypothetical protein EMPG_11374 [Blastomyces silverae]
MPNPYYTFPPDAPLNYSPYYCHNRSDKSPPLRPRLPRCRRRGITHPLPDWVESPFSDPWAYTDPQTHCTLYTALPPEIRFLIFEALLGNRVLHVDTSWTYQKLVTSLSHMPPMKIVRLHITDLPARPGEYDHGDAEDTANLSWEELWLDPVDKLVRHMASTLEELEFMIPADCFELLSRDGKAGAIGGASGDEEAVLCNELRGGKRCRRRLEGVRPGMQYWISCPARPEPEDG